MQLPPRVQRSPRRGQRSPRRGQRCPRRANAVAPAGPTFISTGPTFITAGPTLPPPAKIARSHAGRAAAPIRSILREMRRPYRAAAAFTWLALAVGGCAAISGLNSITEQACAPDCDGGAADGTAPVADGTSPGSDSLVSGDDATL